MSTREASSGELRSGSPSRLGYRPALDGIRGLAIAAVVAFHSFGWPAAGYLGVDLFFVLSGFLITTLLLEERLEQGRVSLRDFYARRALRLLPALIVMLVVVVAFAGGRAVATGNEHHLGRILVMALAGLGYATNLVLATSANSVPSLGHLWSLATEEQFYLLWPPTLALVLLGRRRGALAILALALGLVVFRQFALQGSGVPGYRLDFAPDTRGSSIIIGCIVAVFWRAQRPRPPRLAALGLVFATWLILFDVGRHLYEGGLVIFGAAAALFILRALDPSTLEARVLSVPPLVALGRISYPLYLWHVPVLVGLGVIVPGRLAAGGLARQLVGVVLAIVLAMLSYRFVEKPFLRRKRRLRPTATDSGAATTENLVPAEAV